MKTVTTTFIAALFTVANCIAQTELINPQQMAAMAWPAAKVYIESLGTNESAFQQEFNASIRQMSESEFWKMLNDAYSNAWDGFLVGNVFFAPRFTNSWERTPPSPEFFISIATNRDYHIGLRSSMAKAGLGCSSHWQTPLLCDYLDSLWMFLEDESIGTEWKLHACNYLNSAYQWKIGEFAHNNTNTYDPAMFDLLHGRAPRFFRYLSDTLMSFTNKADISVIAAAEELTALARTYVNRDPQESKAAACAVSAAQDARNCLATVMNNTNYHPRAREHILSQDYWVHVTEYGTNQNYRFEIEEK